MNYYDLIVVGGGNAAFVRRLRPGKTGPKYWCWAAHVI